MHQQIKKMSLIGLILMIFTSVFGFANSPSAFYLMGYSAMPFYLFSALFFFIPFALMMAEMGAAYGDLPAHDGLWQAAHDTRNDLTALVLVGTYSAAASYTFVSLKLVRTEDSSIVRGHDYALPNDRDVQRLLTVPR